MIIYNLFFYIFAFLMVCASIGAVFSRNTVHSVLFLIYAFFNAAGLFILLGAEFLAAILVIVYVGAIAVLFLFVVMMLSLKPTNFKDVFNKNFKYIIALGIFLLIDLILIIYASEKITPHLAISSAALSIDSALTNTEQLGLILYTKYSLPFELSGIVLLVAMISAITLTHRERKSLRKQNIDKQLARNKDNSLKVIKSVKIGQGVDPVRR
jgi:NADH-quinone oxidoreductase subunit J